MKHQKHQQYFTPLYDRVLIRPVVEQTPQSGIIVPDSLKEKPSEGEVISVGHGRLLPDGSLTPMRVQEGQHVLYGKYAGTEIKINGENLIAMREEEILGYLEDEPETHNNEVRNA